MSQESSFDDISSWSQETCRLKLNETLPVLIAQYCNGASETKKVSILKTMVVSLLPVLGADEREREFSAPVMSQTRVLFSSICSSIITTLQESNSSQDLSHSLLHSLQLLVEVISVLEMVIQHMMPSKGDMVSMTTIESLPCNVLSVIQRSFSHCKDSHTVYGDHFPAVSEQLSTLFKRAYSLQKALMMLLEAVSDSTDSSTESLSNVCDGFHDLCRIISGMDTTLLVSTWRFLVKLVIKHKDSIQQSFQTPPLVQTLCNEVESHYCHALDLAPQPSGLEVQAQGSQGTDEKAFARTLKVCSLCFKMLHHLIKEFPEECVEECGPQVSQVLLVLQSVTTPSLQAKDISEKALNDLQRSVLVGIEPLIQLFITSRRFCDSLLAVNQERKPDHSLATLLTLVTILKLLPTATDDARILWLDPVLMPEDEPREDLVSGIFTAMKNCYIELHKSITLPGIMCNGKPQTDVCLYEFIVTHLCGFVASLPARFFLNVERCLLENVLGSDWSAVTVAVDVWCFMARYGSANLCLHHVRLICDLLTSLPTNQSKASIHLTLLLGRLIPLLAPDHQLELLSSYPVERHPDLWSGFPLASLPDSCRDSVCEEIIKSCTITLSDWTESKQTRDIGSAQNIIKHLLQVQQLFGQNDINQRITADLTKPLGKALVCMCSSLSLDKLTGTVLGCIVDISAHTLEHVTSGHILQVLKTASSSIESGSPLTLRLSCINFLRRLAKRTIPTCSEQSHILEHIPILFGKVLSDSNFIIRQQALEAFSSFAEETTHESLVPECIREDDVQKNVVDYLNQIPAHADLLSKRSEVIFLQGQRTRLRDAAERVSMQSLPSDSEISLRGESANMAENSSSRTEEPQSKRHCSDAEAQLRDVVGMLKGALTRLKELNVGMFKRPDWLDAELLSARNCLDDLLSDKETPS
ncbi:uncharacterized protein C1orf112 homolog isoform X1 [Lytechinus variegatus]|uniref:uncharacterized protein C1orf112 homolog isoform X1 n=1 Tax=Lytechinus variegatus TaxID=7654 RepID=UPI001BB28CE6|nr:uncharacterized protein C1orf112 homolog isoform X1 [Lytechinus variegatus]